MSKCDHRTARSQVDGLDCLFGAITDKLAVDGCADVSSI